MNSLDDYARNALQSLRILYDAAHIDATNHDLNTSDRMKAARLSSVAKSTMDKLQGIISR